VTEVLLQEDADGVRVLTLNRPETRNVPDWAGLEQRRIEVMARNRGQIARERAGGTI
jgi:hypothetical protein